MPQNTTFTYDSRSDAEYFQKIYDDLGASTQIVTIPGGGYALVVTYPSGWQPPPDDPGPGGGEESGGDTDQPDEVAANGKPSNPAGTAIPFATYPEPLNALYWPAVTKDKNALVISQRTTEGKIVGRESRRFLADRSNGLRYHVGVDLFCSEGDEIVSIADGKVVAFFRFYKRPSTGEETYALLVKHGELVVNYGEIKADSATRYGWSVGSTVRAGDKIARVSGTSMIHFETYSGSVTKTSRWMKADHNPPSELRDPTFFLVKLSVEGKRLVPGGVVPQNAHASPGVLPGSSDWHNLFGGRRWRFDERGVYTEDARKGEPWRTPGEPNTCRDIFLQFSKHILSASKKHKVNPALIIMTIATESEMARDEGFTGPKTFRWEAHVKNADVSPVFYGTYSAGPMQCLATTVREMLQDHAKDYGLQDYDPFTVAPAINPEPNPVPSLHPLYDPAISIDIGTAEIRMRWSKSKDDPILVAACYNAGGLYASDHSPWGLRVNDNHLDRAAEWYGDACAVLSEVGIL